MASFQNSLDTFHVLSVILIFIFIVHVIILLLSVPLSLCTSAVRHLQTVEERIHRHPIQLLFLLIKWIDVGDLSGSGHKVVVGSDIGLDVLGNGDDVATL